MMKTPGEMHLFVECFSLDELYECVHNNTDDKLAWLIFFNVYSWFYFFLKFYFWGIVSGEYNLDWDFQFKKAAVILSFV